MEKRNQAGSVSAKSASDLTHREKQVRAIFASLKKASDRVPEASRAEVVVEALQYYFHYCKGATELITIEPAAAEDDWVLQSKVEAPVVAMVA
jgi:hypothetical protein